MRKIIKTSDLNYEIQDSLRILLNISRLPSLIVIETVEEED